MCVRVHVCPRMGALPGAAGCARSADAGVSRAGPHFFPLSPAALLVGEKLVTEVKGHNSYCGDTVRAAVAERGDRRSKFG